MNTDPTLRDGFAAILDALKSVRDLEARLSKADKYEAKAIRAVLDKAYKTLDDLHTYWRKTLAGEVKPEGGLFD